MWESIWKTVYDFAILPVLCLSLSCFVGLRYWNRLPRAFKILVVYLIFNLFIEISARAAAIFFRQNLPLLHLYTLGEYWLLSLFYREILDKESVFQGYFKWIVPTVLTLVVCNTVFLQSIFEFNSYAKTLVQFLIILYALDYSFRFSEREAATSPTERQLRLVNAAVLVYYCGSLFIFMSNHFALRMGNAIKILWDINSVLNLIFQIVVLVALWKVVSLHQKSSSSSAPVS
jgi:hypothetical protein